MLFDVDLEPLRSAVGLPATLDRANEVLYVKMRLKVVLQVALRHERLVAAISETRKRPIVLQLK